MQDLSFAEYQDLQGTKSVPKLNTVPHFCHLHLHTPWSLLDGFCRIDELIELAKEYNMTSIGVSEHGNCHSHIEFYSKTKEAGLKPILGCEAYITPNRTWKKAEFDGIGITREERSFRDKKLLKKDGAVVVPDRFLSDQEREEMAKEENRSLVYSYVPTDKHKRLFQNRPKIAHLLMIAKNNVGYSNLIKISTIAHLEGMYYKPRTDYQVIKQYGKGIIATSSCIGGEIPQLILRGRYKVARNLIKFYQKCFEEFYFEIQPSDLPDQKIVNEVLKAWSQELNIKLVATSDAHMLRKDELSVHSALTKIGKGEGDDSDISVYEHCYFKSSTEMLDGGMPEEAVLNAQVIADSCDVEITMGELKLPKFEVPVGFNLDTYLAKLANEGLFDLALRKDYVDIAVYQKRMEYELEIIRNKGLSGYMLIVWDFINFAKRNGILVGPGRGRQLPPYRAICM